MSSWLHHNSTRIQLGVTFTLGAVTATALIFSSMALRRQIATDDLKRSIPPLSNTHHALPMTDYGGAAQSGRNTDEARTAQIAARARQGGYDPELIAEQLARTAVFLGEVGLQKLRNSFVVVVGLGGVGSHAAASLARSGVGRLRVVDFDQVTLSSLNRHAVAGLGDVGESKVEGFRRWGEGVAPWVRVDARRELCSGENVGALLGEWDEEAEGGVREGEGRKPDYVVDAIDNVDSKVELLLYCFQHGIKVVSAMGAGCKSDPTRICVGDISQSIEDPLSKATRRRLRIAGVEHGIPVVFSTEKPGPGKAQLLPVAEEEVQKGDIGNLGVLPDFRVRILPVLGTMPAVFGYTAANHVICDIACYPMEYRAGDKGREKMYEGMLSALQGMEERLVRSQNGQDAVGLRISLGKDDVGYLVEEVYRGKSVISSLTNRLVPVRWRRPKEGFRYDTKYQDEGQKAIKLKMSDLVLMTKEEARRHEMEVLKAGVAPEEFYEASVLEIVFRRQEEEQAFDKYR
jgi:tRNA A37 threonylcarbamoyladenosine dehydratase